MNTLLEYKEYTDFKKYIKESLDEHMFDDDPGVDFDEHWAKSEKGSPEFQYIVDKIPVYKGNRQPIVDMVFNAGDHYVAYIYGGENGTGSWKDYSEFLTSLFANLDERSMLIDLTNDCADDVWTLRITFYIEKESQL